MKFNHLFKYCPVCGSEKFVDHNVKSKICLDCHFNLYVNPAAAVAAFIFNEKDELLVCVRGKEPARGTWDLPGGFIDEQESAEMALQREIKEELGAEVKHSEIIFTLPNEYLFSGWTTPTLDIFFKCKLKDISNIQAMDDVAKIYFVPLSEINPEKFGLKSVRHAVLRYKSGMLRS